MIFGDFQFSLRTMMPNSISRTTEYNWQDAERIGDIPNVQNLGMSSDKIDIEGVFYPKLNRRSQYNIVENRNLNQVINFVAQQFGGMPASNNGYQNIDDIRKSSLCKQANNLINDSGEILGKFVLTSIKETQSYFDKNDAAQKIEFTLSLRRVPGSDESASIIYDENTALATIATNIARSYLRW